MFANTKNTVASTIIESKAGNAAGGAGKSFRRQELRGGSALACRPPL